MATFNYQMADGTTVPIDTGDMPVDAFTAQIKQHFGTAEAFEQKLATQIQPQQAPVEPAPEPTVASQPRAFAGRGRTPQRPTGPEVIDPNNKISSAQSFLRGAGQGATLGFGDEIIGGAFAGIDTVREALPFGLGGDVVPLSFSERYNLGKDTINDGFSAAMQEDPRATIAGVFGGSILPALLTRRVAAGGPLTAGKFNPLKMMSTSGPVGTSTRMGGLAGLGFSEADTTEGMLIDMGIGSTLGLLTGTLGTATGSMLGVGGLTLLKTGEPITALVAGGITKYMRGLLGRGDSVNPLRTLVTPGISVSEGALAGNVGIGDAIEDAFGFDIPEEVPTQGKAAPTRNPRYRGRTPQPVDKKDELALQEPVTIGVRG